MFREKRVLAVVPARGGSQGIPLKNLRIVAGHSLVAHAGRTASALPFIDRAIASTDHPAIAEEATTAGLAVPFLRPAELSGALVSDHRVLAHALGEMEVRDGVAYDIVLMLQPTSPLRRLEDVRRTVEELVEKDLDAVWTVSATNLKFHPLKQLVVGADGRLSYFDPRGATITARQQLSAVHHRNGVAYAIARRCLIEQGDIMGQRSGAVIIDTPTVNIDTMDDLEHAARLFAVE